jgi:hypothetical protein
VTSKNREASFVDAHGLVREFDDDAADENGGCNLDCCECGNSASRSAWCQIGARLGSETPAQSANKWQGMH